MSSADDPIYDEKPAADLQEQKRPEVDEPDDPEAAIFGTPVDGIDADPADAADQRAEVPLDDDRRDDGGGDAEDAAGAEDAGDIEG